MPATEQTWRNTKLMHVFFGVSAVAMLITTVWMLAADHNREWKPVQRKFRQIETWYTQARIAEQDSADYEARRRELEEALAAAQAQPVGPATVDELLTEARRFADENGYNLEAIESASAQLGEAENRDDEQAKIADRARLVEAMQTVVRKAQFDEDKRFSLLKFKRADLDVARSRYNLGVGEGLPEAELQERQRTVEEVKEAVDQVTVEHQQAKTHRLALQEIVRGATAAETTARKELDDHLAKLDQLKKAEADRQLAGTKKQLLNLPILDAFNSPLKIDQIWLPKLTLNNNFSDVARFDRCTTCHQAIDVTGPGSAVVPGYPPRPAEPITVQLQTPDAPPAGLYENRPTKLDAKNAVLQAVYGLTFAESGLIEDRDVAIAVVRPRTPAANAQLQVGDVLLAINDVKVEGDRDRAFTYLVESVNWGQPLVLRLHRGLPHPFSSHPRLDLYAGSTSPHKKTEMGCTICHEGQGSATSFQWASHTPNDPHQMKQWQRDHGWFNNHHWILPMRPDRFIQSSCLKCHHDITELEPSPRFPEPPAEKLVAGYDVIRQYGCFGCHEINGYEGPTRRRGPDMRLEPNYTAAALEVLADPGLNNDERRMAQEVAQHPDRTQVRKLLAEMLTGGAAQAAAADGEHAAGAQPESRLSPATARMAGILGADDETPGQYRKVGPSLRYVKSKLDAAFLNSWIADPTNFRPTTRMPRFFGLYDHLREIKRDEHGRPEMKPKLDGSGQPVKDEEGNVLEEPVYEASPGLAAAKRFEPIEIRAVTAYLLANSQPFEYVEKPRDATAEPSKERGKVVFQTRGCLACHQHVDFPEAKDKQGPDLSRMGDKLTRTDGARWLYSWVREPNRYHARTVMPNLFLETITGADGAKSDPAADVTEFLLASQQGWKPQPLAEVVDEDLDELAGQYLLGTFTRSQTERFLAEGIPPSQAGQLKVDEQVLVASQNMTPQENREHKLLYVGRRTIGRLGCAACHDIPGFEDAKSIGTGLADWGRKEPSKLAFEQIVQYLAQQNFVHGHGKIHDIEEALDPHEMDPDTGFFTEAVLSHEREGFIWQKLREPRSYDYRMTENKDYIERLRMPKFNFDAQQIESAITFVLGLVAEPPASQYVYRAEPRRQAVLDGQRLITKFNCDGCHTLQMDRWKFTYDPQSFADPPPFDDYAFELPHFTPEQLEESKKVDRRGLGQAEVTGMPNPEVGEDDDGRPLHFFGLWKPVAINGHAWLVGGPELAIPERDIVQQTPPVGGAFARYLQPIALAMEQVSNPNAKVSDSWGWVPPPLVGEGSKVQTQWLHNFLLNPYPIRPAVVLRMPKFNLSSDEAARLVNYFAAVDGAQFPYQLDYRTESSYLAAQDQQHPHRLTDALRLITGSEYCVKCHKVGDYTPPGSAAALAPNLDRVYERLRGDYLQKWTGNPKRLLPYTGMPVNFPPDKPADQSLFAGDSLEQVEAVVDLLLNYDTYMKDRTSIKPMVKPPAPAPAAAGGE